MFARRRRLEFLSAITSLALVSTPALGQIAFECRDLPPIPGTEEVAIADLDRDGNLDIAALSPQNSVISIVLGDGAGGFSFREAVGTGPRAVAVASADLDLDGDVDLVTVEIASGDVAVTRNDGAAGFRRMPPVPVAGDPRSIAIGDFDENGIPDLAIALVGTSQAGPGVATLPGLGAALFGAARVFALATPCLMAVVADANQDRNLDVIVAASTGGNVVLLGNGRGGFALGPAIPMNDALGVAAADLNEDGSADVITERRFFHTGAFTVSLSDGQGGYSLSSSFSVLYAPLPMAFADVNADGHVDLIPKLDNFLFFVNDGRGTLEGVVEFTLLQARATASGDFDEDGLADLTSGHAVCLNRLHRERAGNVGAGVGPPLDVLFVSGSPGSGRERAFETDRTAPIVVEMRATSSRPSGPSRFALFGWAGFPGNQQFNLPSETGRVCLPTPLTPSVQPQPRAIWNNFRGRGEMAGAPRFPSSPAPSVVFTAPSGVGRRVDFFLQGIISDSFAPNGRVAVTNGIAVRIR